MPAPPVLVVDSETPTLVVQPTQVQVKPPPKSEPIILAVPMLVDPLTGHDTRSWGPPFTEKEENLHTFCLSTAIRDLSMPYGPGCALAAIPVSCILLSLWPDLRKMKTKIVFL